MIDKKRLNITIDEGSIKAFFHTFWHLLGTLLPFLIVIVLSNLFCRSEEIMHFIDTGDFCLFSAAILTPASYILSQISKDEKRKVRRWPSIYYALSITIILGSSMLFSGVFITELFPNLSLDTAMLRTMSIIFLILSCVLYFLAHKINNYYENPVNAKGEERAAIDELDQAFDRLPN
jgi:hypothetical protein